MDNLLAGEFVTDDEEVRENLDIVKRDASVSVLCDFRLVLRHEMHLLDHLEATIRLICRRHRERGHGVASVGDVVCDSGLVGLVENILNEVDIGSCVGMHFLTKCLGDERPEMVLVLNMLLVDHLGSLRGEVSRIILDTSPVVKGQSSPKRRVPSESFDFNSRRIFSKGILIDRIPIDEVDACATF